MEKDSCIVYISLLGDPDVEFGIPGTGGYNKTVRELLDYYSTMPVTVFVITNKNIYNSCSVSKLYDNIKINRIDFGVDWDTNQELIADNIELIFYNVCEIIESVKLHYEIKLIHSFYWLSGYISSLVKKKYSLPFVHTVISLAEDKLSVGISPHTDKQRRIEDMFLKKADWIFAITPQEKQTLIQKYGISDTKIIIVGRSVSRTFLEVFDKKEQYKNTVNEVDNIKTIQNDSWWVNGAFLYVGRIVTIKGVKQIITAWIYSKERYNLNIPLWIVGGTPNQIEIMRKSILCDCPRLTEYENDNRIIWWGSLSSSDISSLMRKSQALIMHSMFEAGGRVIIEALSAGIPVIATPFGYGKDYVFDGFNGYIVDFGDISSLSKAMMRFADNPFLSSVMGKAAFTLMRKVHESWDYYGTHNNIYKSFLKDLYRLSIKPQTDLLHTVDSYKMRHCVDSFPYFSTDRNTSKLLEIVSQKIDCHDITPINDSSLHSDFYIIKSNDNEYFLRCFYHILSDRLTRCQYKTEDVIPAYSQAQHLLLSTKYNSISNIIFCDIPNLLCVMPRFNLIENESLNCLFDFWFEEQPDKNLLDLYIEGNYYELDKQIIESKSPMINSLFCAEIACTNLFSPNDLPEVIKQKMQQLKKTGPAIFGLNYGKGVKFHTIEENGRILLLPTSSIFLGELGFDLVLTFLQTGKDNPKLWKNIKSKQSIISDKRLDLWFLIIVFALEEEDHYQRVIESILLN